MNNEVTVLDMCNARDQRADNQKKLINQYHLPLISFSMNIAGPVKTSPLVLFSFFSGIKAIESVFKIQTKQIYINNTGPEALFVLNESPFTIKDRTQYIENSTEIGRLWDIDVIQTNGEKVSRITPRKCLICGDDAHICARSRLHDLHTIIDKTDEILLNHAADELALSATQSLIDEVSLTPKPGLVDMNNNGAHTDMDINLFKKSAFVLQPFFKTSFEIGYQLSNDSSLAITVMKKEGINAEAAMFTATNGVNTHKGTIFSMGLTLCSLGMMFKNKHSFTQNINSLLKEQISKDYTNAIIHPHSNGEKIYCENNIGGAREEALNGFPHAIDAAKYILSQRSNNPQIVQLYALMRIIASLDDTNVIHRGGMIEAEKLKQQAKKIADYPENELLPALENLDHELIKKNISPGGAADILALSVFMSRIYKKLKLCEINFLNL